MRERDGAHFFEIKVKTMSLNLRSMKARVRVRVIASAMRPTCVETYSIKVQVASHRRSTRYLGCLS